MLELVKIGEGPAAFEVMYDHEAFFLLDTVHDVGPTEIHAKCGRDSTLRAVVHCGMVAAAERRAEGSGKSVTLDHAAAAIRKAGLPRNELVHQVSMAVLTGLTGKTREEFERAVAEQSKESAPPEPASDPTAGASGG